MKKILRTAYVGNNYADKDISKGIKVELNITSGLKPLAFSQTDGKGSNTTINRTADTIEYNLAIDKSYTDKKVDADVKNVLVDPDDTDRFIYIGHAESNITKTSTIVYYDSKYKDIIVMPDLESIIPIDDTTLKLDNKKFTIDCKIIVSNISHLQNNTSNDAAHPIKETDVSAFPEPQNISGIAIYTFMIGDLYNQSKVSNSGFMFNSGDRYIEGTYNRTVELMGFGSTDTLFGSDFKHTSFLLRRFNDNKYTIEYISDQVLDDILVAIG